VAGSIGKHCLETAKGFDARVLFSFFRQYFLSFPNTIQFETNEIDKGAEYPTTHAKRTQRCLIGFHMGGLYLCLFRVHSQKHFLSKYFSSYITQLFAHFTRSLFAAMDRSFGISR